MADNATVKELQTFYPFLQSMPQLSGDLVFWIEEGYSDSEIVARMRQHNEYKARFPAMFDETGQMRFSTEADYISEERALADVMSMYGDPGYRYDQPGDFAAFIKLNINAQQLDARFELYQSLENSSADIRAAFYVYAGMDLSTDDLYSIVVNPSEQQRLWTDYSQRSAVASLDMETYNLRLAEFATKESTRAYQQLRDEGLVTDRQFSDFTARVSDMAVELTEAFSRKMADPNDDTPEFLTVQQAQQALQYALIGSAATAHGFSLEDDATIQQFIERGVTRSSALQAYGTLASQGARLQSLVDRSGVARDGFNMLGAVMTGAQGELTDAASRTALSASVRAEDARFNQRGSARVEASRAGALEQSGLRIR